MIREESKYFAYKQNTLDGVFKYMIETKENYTLLLNSTNFYSDTNRFMAIDSSNTKYLATYENSDCSFTNQFFSVSFKHYFFKPIGFSLRSSFKEGSMQKFSIYASKNYKAWDFLYKKDEDDDSLIDYTILSSKVNVRKIYKHFLIKMDGKTKTAEPSCCRMRVSGFDLFGTLYYNLPCTIKQVMKRPNIIICNILMIIFSL